MSFLVSYTAQQPIDDFGLNVSSLKYSALLPATTDTTLTIPGDAKYYKAVIKTFPVGGALFVSLNATAEIAVAPTGGMLNATSSELVEVTALCRQVKAGDVLHFMATNDGTPVSVVLYALESNG